ncbi:hypothetical protein HMPREF3069_26755 [Achromobacter xylosoxidans]|nr:hypothetical protein HMPREF2772_14150 [Achromobacter xylosoxidans]OFS35099.1 hypothetical protein HMPREF3069_26755 [Achromobacter xylosoxidans]
MAQAELLGMTLRKGQALADRFVERFAGRACREAVAPASLLARRPGPARGAGRSFAWGWLSAGGAAPGEMSMDDPGNRVVWKKRARASVSVAPVLP